MRYGAEGGIRKGQEIMTRSEMKIPRFADWPVYPIIMPVDALGRGPADLGGGAIEVRFEVWERGTLSSLGSYLYLCEAIDHCLRVMEEGE